MFGDWGIDEVAFEVWLDVLFEVEFVLVAFEVELAVELEGLLELFVVFTFVISVFANVVLLFVAFVELEIFVVVLVFVAFDVWLVATV